MRASLSGSEGTCAKCLRHASGRQYTFHIGVKTGFEVSRDSPYVRRRTSYRLLGRRSEFVCARCAWRHLALRYVLPLLVCLLADLTLTAGALARVHAVTQSAAIVLFVAAVTWYVTGARGTAGTAPLLMLWRTLKNEQATGLNYRYFLGRLLWWCGLFGPIVLGEFTQAAGSGGPGLAIVAAIVAACHLYLWVSVLVAWPVLLEDLAWRTTLPRLRRELEQPHLIAFNTLTYATLHTR